MFRTMSTRVAAISLVALLPLGAACASTPAPKPEAAPASAPTAARATEGQLVELSVTEEGFVPSPVTVKEGEPVTLVITRKTAKTCATEIMIPAYDIEEELPLNVPVTITFTPTKTGEIKYGCGMGQMIAGVLVVE